MTKNKIAKNIKEKFILHQNAGFIVILFLLLMFFVNFILIVNGSCFSKLFEISECPY